MAVALQGHQLGDLHGAELGHPTDVVASEIDEHDVLGNFLRVLLQLAGHTTVIIVITASTASARYGPADNRAAQHLHHRLGRTARNGDIRVAQEVHVRAGVHLPKHPIEVERVGLEVDVVTLSEHHLEDVAGQDVFLGHLHRLLIHAVGHRAAHRRGHLIGLRRLGRRREQRHRQPVDGALCTQARGVVFAIDAGRIHLQYRHALDEIHALAPVVEGCQRANDAHDRIGQPSVVMRCVGQVLHFAHHVVTEVTHHATLQRRQIRDDRRSVGRNDCVECREHSLIERDVGAQVLALDLDQPVA